jgi:hypothetical protein
VRPTARSGDGDPAAVPATVPATVAAACWPAQRVRDAVRESNSELLDQVHGRLAAAGAGEAAGPVADLRDAIASAGAAAGATLVDPRLGRWLKLVSCLVDRDAPRLLPPGVLRGACLDAGAFAAGVRAACAPDRAAATRVRVGADGVVRLYGTGRALRLPLSLAGSVVLVGGHADRPVAVDAGGTELRAVVDTEWTPLPGLVAPVGADLGALEAVPVLDELLLDGPPVVVLEQEQGGPPSPGIAVVGSGAPAEARVAHVLAAVANLRLAAAGGADGPFHGSGSAVRTTPGSSRWRAGWTGAGGRWRAATAPAGSLDASSQDLRDVLTELGCTAGAVEINVLGRRNQRADPTFDNLSLLSIQEPERYRGVIARVLWAPECDARTLLLGHHAYIEQEMCSAASTYAKLIVRHPHAIDLWRDFVFALRHLGSPRPCDTWLRRPDEVVARAVACAPDPEPLTRLVSLSDRGRTGPPAQRFPLGLLEWIGCDLDNR